MMSSESESEMLKEVVSSKRGRPVRGKVVKEVDWLSVLSEGLEVGRELELVVVGEGGAGGGVEK